MIFKINKSISTLSKNISLFVYFRGNQNAMIHVLKTMNVAKAELVIKYALIVSAYAENVKTTTNAKEVKMRSNTLIGDVQNKEMAYFIAKIVTAKTTKSVFLENALRQVN